MILRVWPNILKLGNTEIIWQKLQTQLNYYYNYNIGKILILPTGISHQDQYSIKQWKSRAAPMSNSNEIYHFETYNFAVQNVEFVQKFKLGDDFLLGGCQKIILLKKITLVKI